MTNSRNRRGRRRHGGNSPPSRKPEVNLFADAIEDASGQIVCVRCGRKYWGWAKDPFICEWDEECR